MAAGTARGADLAKRKKEDASEEWLQSQNKHTPADKTRLRKSAERKDISFKKIATTRGKNIFLLVLEFSNHLPRFRPCLYISWEALVFFSFRACIVTSVHFKLIIYYCCLFMRSLGSYYWRLLLPGFMHFGRCGNTKHEQVAGGLDLLVPMQDLPTCHFPCPLCMRGTDIWQAIQSGV